MPALRVQGTRRPCAGTARPSLRHGRRYTSSRMDHESRRIEGRVARVRQRRVNLHSRTPRRWASSAMAAMSDRRMMDCRRLVNHLVRGGDARSTESRSEVSRGPLIPNAGDCRGRLFGAYGVRIGYHQVSPLKAVRQQAWLAAMPMRADAARPFPTRKLLPPAGARRVVTRDNPS